MASIQNSRAEKYARLIADEPREHLESIGDCLIKELAKKQTDTSLTLEKQFHQEKQFQKGIGFVSLSSFAAGTSSLENFKKVNKDAEIVQQLTARGLTYKEANRYVNSSIPCSSKAEGSAQQAQQDLLSKCLENNESNKLDADMPRVSRQERELALSVKPNSVETQLLKFALTCKQPTVVDTRPKSHPINKLAQIEQELFREHVDPMVLAKTVKRKRRQQLDADLPPQDVPFNPIATKSSSLWDLVNKPVFESTTPFKSYGSIKRRVFQMKDGKMEEVDEITEGSGNKEDSDDWASKSHDVNLTEKAVPKRYGCVKQRMFTIKDGKILEVEEGQQSEKIVEERQAGCNGQTFITTAQKDGNISLNDRITEDEIKQMPKFKNYEHGELNKVLYIKNIAKSVKEEDLGTVFSRFQDPEGPKLLYRLMSGKMKGQAFVTFPSSAKAAAALDSVNGLVFKGKPWVIQFGRDNS